MSLTSLQVVRVYSANLEEYTAGQMDMVQMNEPNSLNLMIRQ
jgi:hypothetical protein